jgi:squalene synthase HpnC
VTTLEQAYDACRDRARTHYENFPIGSFLLPRHLRKDLAAVYAFARMGDDLADEGNASAGARLAALDTLEARLMDAVAAPARADGPVLFALAHTIASRALPVAPFQDLLAAFRRDAAGETREFAAFEDVLAYCRLSANPVGRIVLALFGYRDDARVARSDDICTALQMTNFWQDVRSDFTDRGRIAIPRDDLERFEGARDAIVRGQATPGFRACLGVQVERTRVLFDRGLALADLVDGRLRREVRLFAGGGRVVLDRIAAADYDVFGGRPRLGRGDVARLIWKEVWR